MSVSACFPTKSAPYRLALVVGSPQDVDLLYGKLYAGTYGKELNAQLRLANIDREACLLTTVFDKPMPASGIRALCAPRKEQERLLRDANVDPQLASILRAAVERGAYVLPEHARHLERLRSELLAFAPNVIVVFGNIALWAVCGITGIAQHRGSLLESALVPRCKVIPTFDPATVFNVYNNRPIVVADLVKACREAQTPEWEPVKRELWLDPTLDDLRKFEREHLLVDPRPLLSVDIETSRGQIDCIGFAPSRYLALVVPFVDWRKPNRSYWATAEEEREAWLWCKSILENDTIPKLGQNFSYDLQWLAVKVGIFVRNYCEDTCLLHHALYPELPKDLGFLGSVYEQEGSWKLMRRGKAVKRDE